jgi:flagellar basal-body rod modification protein FlgD
MEPGTHSFEWDGTSDNGDTLEEGVYNFAVTAIDSAGQELTVESFISGLVDRVNIEGGTPMLYVGDVPVALPSVRDVRMPAES